MLKKNSNYEEPNNYGKTPLHITAEFGAAKCLNVLKRHVNEQNKGLDEIFNVNMKDFNGNTPLHLAAINGHCPLVRVRLQTNLKFKIYSDFHLSLDYGNLCLLFFYCFMKSF